jgi:hypothetical protein
MTLKMVTCIASFIDSANRIAQKALDLLMINYYHLHLLSANIPQASRIPSPDTIKGPALGPQSNHHPTKKKAQAQLQQTQQPPALLSLFLFLSLFISLTLIPTITTSNSSN